MPLAPRLLKRVLACYKRQSFVDTKDELYRYIVVEIVGKVRGHFLFK